MPSRPPETLFYQENAENQQLWRDVSRLFEDFVGGDTERIWRFETVLRDVLVRIYENAPDKPKHNDLRKQVVRRA